MTAACRPLSAIRPKPSPEEADVDGDGDDDILNGIGWYENLGGGLFGAMQAIHDQGGLGGPRGYLAGSALDDPASTPVAPAVPALGLWMRGLLVFALAAATGGLSRARSE